jgi:glucose/arabinose dehydrogenase
MQQRERARPAHHRRLLAARVGALVLAGSLLAACGSAAGGSGDGGPTWVPQPRYTLEPNPFQPQQGQSSTPAPSESPTAPSTGPSGAPTTPAADPSVVATGLSAPVGIAVLEDGSALVGERSTGRILRVQATAGKPVVAVRTLTGLDATGDGGLLDLALSATYDQDGLIFAYITTPTDNRVVAFTLNGPVTPVFTGIPKGPTDNAGRIAVRADGTLLVGTGDAGQPALAQNPASFAGKVLQMTDTGQPITGTPTILSSGHHVVAGLCIDTSTSAVFESEPGSASVADEVNLLSQGGDYGWPTPTATSRAPLAVVPAAQAQVSGCTATGGVLYLAGLDGKALFASTLTRTTTSVKLSALTPSLSDKYGRLLTVVAAPDGSLWLTTSNKDGHGTPVADDERVLHIIPAGGGNGSKA